LLFGCGVGSVISPVEREGSAVDTFQPSKSPVTVGSLLRDVLYMALGIACMGMGIKGFLMSSHFIDGGVTGISMLLAELFHLPLPWLIALINIPFVLVGFQRLGAVFAVKSILTIGGLAVCLATVPYPDVTPDKLLTAVFGGFFIGTGIGLAMRGGAVLDGTEISAILLSRSTSVKVGDIILLFNIVIFGSALCVLGVEESLYSILTYLAASQTVNFLTHGIEQHTAIIIVSSAHQAVKDDLTPRLQGSVWELFTLDQHQTPSPLLYAVVSKLEVGSVKKAVLTVDPHAWMVVHPLSEALTSGPPVAKAGRGTVTSGAN